MGALNKNGLYDDMGHHIVAQKHMTMNNKEKACVFTRSGLYKKGQYESMDNHYVSQKEINMNNKDNDANFMRSGLTKVDKMEELVDEVKVITALINDQNRQDEIEEEWQILGKVFDRLLFFFFIL